MLYQLQNREFADLLKIAKRKEARLLAALAAGGLVLSPALATTTAKKRAPAVAVSFDPISSFTPANADPKLAAALAGKGLALTDFKFTPAPAKGRPSQVRVAIRARAHRRTAGAACRSNAPATAISALAPTSYNLGVALGWKRFAISGDVAKREGREFGAWRPRERNRRRQLLVEALHRPRCSWGGAERRSSAAGAAQGRQRIRWTSAAPIRCRRKSPSPAASATISSAIVCPPSRTCGAIARPFMSAPRSSFKRANFTFAPLSPQPCSSADSYRTAA